MKVIVVDSGISKEILEKSPELLVHNFTNEGKYDLNGHGTQSYSLIKMLSHSGVEIKIIKILDANLECEYRILREALLFLTTINFNIANLSLATENLDYSAEIDELCKVLYNQGKILISSYSNTGKKSYPASSPYTIGVLGKTVYNRCMLYKNKSAIIADDRPVVVKTLKDYYDLYGGNSKAACCITAERTYKNRKEFLIKYNENSNFYVSDLMEIIKKINKMDYFYNISPQKNLVEHIGRENFKYFLLELSKKFFIDFTKNTFIIDDFLNIESLARRIYLINKLSNNKLS